MVDVKSPYEEEAEKSRNKWIGIYVGILGALLAICSMGGGNATKDAMRANIDASDAYNYYQAKNGRQLQLRLQVEQLELMIATTPAMPPEVKKSIESKIEEHKSWIARYESDPKSNEGKKELLVKAGKLEAERDVALKRDPFFDISQALLQVAIVMAGVSLLTSSNLLLWLSAFMAIGGGASLINGYMLFMEKVPFVG